MSAETVELYVWVAPVGAPYNLGESVDTGLTRAQWDALTPEEKEEIAGRHIDDLTRRAIESGWSEKED